MSVNKAYEVTEIEIIDKKDKNNSSASENNAKANENNTKANEKNGSAFNEIYSYDEALDLSGVGWYTRGLLSTLSLSLLSMAMDMFGFSVVVTGCACDFDLDHSQKSILISVPFIGPIVMAYLWGYISDTQGRRKTLLIGLGGSFVCSVIAAFSTHWYMLAVVKILGTSMSSSVQATSYTYLGESSPQRVRGPYLFIMSSMLLLFMLTYDVPAYFILKLDFSPSLGYITFTPWRLLTLVLGAPLGVSTALLFYFCESPKFLLNAGREKEGLDSLRIIWKRNGGKDHYRVNKVVLSEIKIRSKEESLASSFYEQIRPLFRPPLLWRTIQLFYLTAVIYGVNNSLIMWMPMIVKAFSASTGKERPAMRLCDIIISSQNTTSADMVICTSSINHQTLISGVAHGLILSTIGLAVSKLASRKKAVLITFFLVPLICCIASVYNTNDVASLVLYVGMLMTNISMGVIFTYFVDIYPTSHTGMASCLAVMVSRLSALACIHFVGQLVLKYCVFTFYGFAVYLLSGILVAYFLPPDRPIQAESSKL